MLASVAATHSEAQLAGLGIAPDDDAIADALLSGFGLGFVLAGLLAFAAVVVAFSTAPRRPTAYDFQITRL